MKRYRIRRLTRRPEDAGAEFKTHAQQAMEDDEHDATRAPPEIERSFNRGCMGCTTAFLILAATMLVALFFGQCIRPGP